MLRLVTVLASLVSTVALAGTPKPKPNPLLGDAVAQAVCHAGECTIFRVVLDIEIDGTVTVTNGSPTPQTRIVVNDVVYYDDEGSQIEYKTKVVQQGNTCEKRYVLNQKIYHAMIATFDSIIDDEGNVVPQMNKTQQAFMGFFLSLIDDKAQFQCSAVDLDVEK